MTNKDIFSNFMQNLPNYTDSLLKKFDQYNDLILEHNTIINLISRHTESSIWTSHFLDSILPYDLMNLHNKKILDFGTGAGLPGIPIKIIYPSISLYLLEAKRKKSLCLKNIIEQLNLTNCYIINKRLEDITSQYKVFFDIILSRAIKIDKTILLNLLLILKTSGRIILYKGQNFQSELKTLPIKEMKVNYHIAQKNNNILGKRNYIIFEKV
ncbi:MAG: 16S rRNA (guanine(527)-N(7))-methyltransferase RsmG [Candidatus Cloacimonadota bacterium]|nr:MAG: 16S rRNA (guanine(527)-N(7))-methyltransferase RsmG [Candidatus Cloacimonadota bacterium]